MDIAIITTRLVDYDAIGNFTMASAAAFSSQGKVAVYTFAYERPAIDRVMVRFLGGRNGHSMGTNLRSFINTRTLARELSKFDALLVVNPDIGSIMAYHLAKRYNPRLKVIWRFHGTTPPEFLSTARDRILMRVRNMAYKWSMRRSDLVLTDSEYIRGELIKTGVDKSMVSAARLGVDIDRFSRGNGRKIRDRFGIGDKFTILYVGRLVNFKHVDELIRAVSGVDGIFLLIAGGGPESQSLQKLCSDLGIGDRVRLAGRVHDQELPEYYAACDAWVTASSHEGFCVPIIEAMAAGKPVIVPRVTAMPETAGDGGLTYRKGDVEDLDNKLGLLMGDKGLYRDMANKALKRAAGFEMRHVLESYIKDIADIVNN